MTLSLHLLLSEQSSFSCMQSRPEAASPAPEGLVTALGREEILILSTFVPLPPMLEGVFWASDWVEMVNFNLQSAFQTSDSQAYHEELNYLLICTYFIMCVHVNIYLFLWSLVKTIFKVLL